MNLTSAIRKFRPKRPRPPRGTPAGTVRSVPTKTPTKIDVIHYDGTTCQEIQEPTIDQISGLLTKGGTIWINIVGLTDVERLKKIGSLFNLHTLALEDSINLYQRPKIENYDHYYYAALRMADIQHKSTEIEQVSLFFGKGFMITIQERPGDCFNPIRQRIRGGKSSLVKRGSDYLASAIMDAIIDDYFPHIEHIADRLEILESEILETRRKDIVQSIYALRQELLVIRRAIWPLRDALAIMYREQSEIVEPETKFYFRDCYDHTVQIIDALETYRDLIGNMMEIYLSSVSYRLNDIMRTLTVISTVFMPLNLIAGIYGMNFHPDKSPWNMPELNWYYGYPAVIGLMLATVLGSIYFFYRKGWLRS